MESTNKPVYLREASIKFRKKRVKNDAPANETMADPNTVYELFRDLEDEMREKFLVLALDSQLKLLCFEVVAMGSVDAVYGKPAEALRIPIAMGASGVILVHNHPSGDPTPSEPDHTFTRRIKGYCDDLGMPIHDHIIIGTEGFYSFNEQGLL